MLKRINKNKINFNPCEKFLRVDRKIIFKITDHFMNTDEVDCYGKINFKKSARYV